MTTSADKDVEKLEPSFTADENVDWHSPLATQFASPQVATHSYHLTQHFLSSYIPQRSGNISPHNQREGDLKGLPQPGSISQGPEAEGGPHLGLVQAELQPCRGPRLPEGTDRIKRGLGRGCMVL